MLRTPERIPLSIPLRRMLPRINRALEGVDGNLLDAAVQAQVDQELSRFDEWNRWLERARRPLSPVPWSVGPGVPTSPAFLVGLSRGLYPGFELSPYDIGPAAVTEVIAQPGATALSHSQNDLPAPVHTAGFFEEHPPLVAVFAGVRRHPGGGAETVVADVERVLGELAPEHRETLRDHDCLYRTPARSGGGRHPFRVLTEVEKLPFVRFRMDYTVGGNEAIRALDAALRQQRNLFLADLAPGEVLFVWNGAPHGRLPQCGPTPREQGQRRKLLRCRLRRSSV